MGENKRKGAQDQEAINIWDCGSPLYDSYEIASLGHVIERHTLALPSPLESNRFSKQSMMIMPREEKGREVRKEGFHEEGVLSRLLRAHLWMRNIFKGENGKAGKVKRGFQGLCRSVGRFCRQNALKLKRVRRPHMSFLLQTVGNKC